MRVKYAIALLTSTVVVGVEQGKESANSKDVVVLSELGHGYCGCCWPQVAMSTKEWWSAWSWDAEESRGLSGQYIYTLQAVGGLGEWCAALSVLPSQMRRDPGQGGHEPRGPRKANPPWVGVAFSQPPSGISRRAGRTCQKGAL
jgi:hypothetical protein